MNKRVLFNKKWRLNIDRQRKTKSKNNKDTLKKESKGVKS